MVFADLYLGHPEIGNRFTSVPKAPINPVIAGPSLAKDLEMLHTKCHSLYAGSNREFRLIYDDVGYRVAVMNTMNGPVFVLRRMEQTVYCLSELGMPSPYIQELLEPGITGLFIVSGVMNSGKTTTASSIVSERLKEFGGVAVTAEDPVEVPLEGMHGTGICFQTSASRSEGGYGTACRALVRYGAEIIYLGEIRDGETAVEALRAGVNGHLILSTLHTDDIPSAIRRLQALVSETYSPDAANALLSDGLAGILHQRLVGKVRRLEAELFMIHKSMAARTMIRQGHFERLVTEMQNQKARMIRDYATAGGI